MGFVEDHDRETVFVLDEVIKNGTNAGDHLGTAEEGFVAQDSQNLAVKARHAQQGVGEVDDEVAVGIQTGNKAAQSGGLA